MSYYFTFEATKFCKNLKNIVILILAFFITILGVFYLGSIQTKETDELKKELTSEYMQLYTVQLDFFQVGQGYRALEEIYSGSKISSIEVQEILQLCNTGMEKIDSYLASLSSDNWREIVTAHLEYLKILQELTLLEIVIPVKYSDINIATEIEKDRYFLDKNIKPNSAIYGYSGIGYLNYVSEYIFSVFGLIFLCLLFFDLYRQEYESNTIRLIYTLPIERNKIFRAKMALSFLVYLASVFILISLALLVGTIYWKNFGSIKYPIVLTTGKKISSLTFSSYFLMNLVLFSLYTLFELNLIRRVSTVVKGMSTSFFSILVVTCVPSILTNEFFLPVPYAYINPFYFNRVSEATKKAFESHDLFRYFFLGGGVLFFFSILGSKLKGRTSNEICT